MKMKGLLVSLSLVVTLFAGCTPATPASTNPVETPKTTVATTNAAMVGETTASAKPDAVSSASVAKDEMGLVNGLGKNGAWLVSIKANMETTKDLVIEGDYTTPDKVDKTKMVPAGRKLALYDQDAKRVKTATYTLKAPKLTIKSANSRIVGGTFIGDVYVEAKGFYIEDGKVQGNIYFANDEVKSTFKLTKGSTVSGVQEIKK